MKKFSKLIAVVLAIAVIICPMMSVVSHATTTNGYKIEANPNDANELMLTISSTDGFVAYDATVTFNSTDAFQDDCNTGDYVDGLRLISYEVDGGEGNSHNLPRIYSSMPNDTTLKMIVIKNDFSATGMYTELVIGIRVAAGSTATLTKIQAADEGTVADDPTLLTFPAANESTGEIDQTDEYAKENATITVHTHDLTLVPANDPTCTDDGNYAYYTCSGCDKIFSDSQGTNETTSQAVTRPATGHTWGEYVSNNDATCTADGTKKRTCSECGATETITDVGSALGHTPATAVVENNVPATCTTDGSYDSVVKCSVCKTELSRETVIVKATGHTPATAVEENRVEATCGVAGSYDSVVYCSECGAEISRTPHTIPATGNHTWGEWTTDADGHSRTCSVCNAVDSGTHSGNPCSVCGYEAAPAEPVVDASITSALTCKINIATTVGITYNFALPAGYDDFYIEVYRQKCNDSYNIINSDTTVFNRENVREPGTLAWVYSNIAMYEMSLPITATAFCLKDGVVVAKSAELTTSVAALIVPRVPSVGVKTKALYVDLLYMGAAAQDYFRTLNPKSGLASVEMPTADLDPAYTRTATYTDLDSTSSYENTHLSLEGKLNVLASPSISYVVSNLGAYDPNTLTMTLTHHSNVLGDVTIEQDLDSTAKFLHPSIALYDLNKTITTTILDDEENVLATCQLSLESLINSKLSAGVGTKTRNLYESVVIFGQSARAYFTAAYKYEV